MHKPKDEMVGGWLPRPLHDKFGLRALHLGTTKAALIKELITKYVEEGPSTDTMITAVAISIANEAKRDPSLSVDEVKRKLFNKVAPEIAEEILNKIKAAGGFPRCKEQTAKTKK